MNLRAVFPPCRRRFSTARSTRGDTEQHRAVDALGAWRGLVLGTNGEAPLLDDDEADRVIEAARRAVPAGRTLLVGAGRESTRATIAAARRAAAGGADAVVVRTPSLYRAHTPVAALADHYLAVADASPMPVLLYNYPAFTGVNLDARHDRPARRASQHRRREGNEHRRRAVRGDGGRRARSTSRYCAGSAPGRVRGALCRRARGDSRGCLRRCRTLCLELVELTRAGRAGGGARAAAASDAARARGHDDFGIAGLKAALDVAGYVGGDPRPPLLPARRRRHRKDPDAVRCGFMLPSTERLLLGPGPSPVSPRVMRAMSAPLRTSTSRSARSWTARRQDLARGAHGFGIDCTESRAVSHGFASRPESIGVGGRYNRSWVSSVGSRDCPGRRLRLRLLHLSDPSRRSRVQDRQSDDDSIHGGSRARGGVARRARRPRSTLGAYSRIPQNLKRAVLVTEDSAFWTHDGVDLNQLRESVEVNLERGEFARGASTITQQLARNLYLSPSKNLVRKARELLIARRLEASLSKQRIFELYLNVIEWGDGVWGAEAASRRYFHKPASELTAPEAALLAGAISSPRNFDPAHPSARLKRRQQMIMRRMGAATPPPVIPEPTVLPVDAPLLDTLPALPPAAPPTALPGTVVPQEKGPGKPSGA